MSTKQKIAIGFLAVSIIAWLLRKLSVFYIPGLSALTLCVAMIMVGADMLKGGKQKRLPGILIMAMGLTMLVFGGFEIYGYILGK